jgi:hypothetical protein
MYCAVPFSKGSLDCRLAACHIASLLANIIFTEGQILKPSFIRNKKF